MIKLFSKNPVLTFLLFTLVVTLNSCKDDELVMADQIADLQYFPLETGYWVEYDADSIIHLDIDDIHQVDTAILSYHFQIRQEVDTPFIDGENQKAYVIVRSKRDNNTLPWVVTNVWTAKINPFSAQLVEDNVRFIRLAFPIGSSVSWNGNAFNFYPEEEYSFEDVYEPKQIGSLSFDSTVTVLQNDFISNINRIYKKEIYGAHAGLLYKQIDSVNTVNTVNGTVILNGFEYKLNITGYKH